MTTTDIPYIDRWPEGKLRDDILGNYRWWRKFRGGFWWYSTMTDHWWRHKDRPKERTEDYR